MDLIISRVRSFPLMFVLLVAICSFSDCYDPLDPNGNITITFDIVEWTNDGYVARVMLQNYYMYRHVDNPGWKLGWMWARNEVIWSISGAFATQQGNCTLFKARKPHSCEKDPIILDLQGGLLTAWAIKPDSSYSSFEVTVGNLESNTSGYKPLNLTLMGPGPGYTCSTVEDVAPTVSSVIGGRRQEQVFQTWKSTCTYSTYLANKTPTCCVSLSTFYNPTITSCPQCSCGCKPKALSAHCMSDETISINSRVQVITDKLRCTDHMCPLRVHWHYMTNYRDHWRVKLTISNYNYARNYSDWNVLVEHPGFSQSMTTYSFNNTLLPAVGIKDEVALFWGLDYFNNKLVHADEDQLGAVTTEILLKKDPESFTMGNGWVFPRRIYINGENCQMPLPDDFPMLPNNSPNRRPSPWHFLLSILIYVSCIYCLITEKDCI